MPRRAGGVDDVCQIIYPGLAAQVGFFGEAAHVFKKGIAFRRFAGRTAFVRPNDFFDGRLRLQARQFF